MWATTASATTNRFFLCDRIAERWITPTLIQHSANRIWEMLLDRAPKEGARQALGKFITTLAIDQLVALRRSLAVHAER